MEDAMGWSWVILFAAGVAGGFANAVAGGASLLCMPALVFFGLPVDAAIATNKLATTAQSVYTAARYGQKGFFNKRVWMFCAGPALFGAAFGAYLLVSLAEFKEVLHGVVIAVLLVALALILFVKRDAPAPEETPLPPRTSPWGALLVGVIGVYGGFFGGGVGLVLAPLLYTVFRLDYVSANGVKAGLGAVMNVTALSIFVWSGLVLWLEGACLVAGMLVGANIGVNTAVERGEAWVRGALVLATVATVVYLVV